MPSVSIVIVNWNSGDLLARCLDSIARHRGSHVDRIVVLDNASEDGSADFVEANGDVELIRSPANLGFAKACNLGAARCRESPYLLFLNPDAELKSDSLSPSLAYLESSEGRDAGIVGCKLVDERGATQRCCARFPTALILFGAALGLDRIAPSIFKPHLMVDFDHEESAVVDQVIGAFFLIRRKVFLDLDGFDERFFVYFEEVDFCLRASRIGWVTVYRTDASAFHLGGGTSGRVKAARLFYSLRSRLQYAAKHFSIPSYVATLITTLAIEPVTRLAKAILSNSPASSLDVIWGTGQVWRWAVVSGRCWERPRRAG